MCWKTRLLSPGQLACAPTALQFFALSDYLVLLCVFSVMLILEAFTYNITAMTSGPEARERRGWRETRFAAHTAGDAQQGHATPTHADEHTAAHAPGAGARRLSPLTTRPPHFGLRVHGGREG